MNNQVKLIDAEKLKMWILQNDDAEAFLDSEDSGSAFNNLCRAIENGAFDPDTPTIKPGDRVLHGIYGPGTAVSEEITHGNTVFVDYDDHRGGPHITLVRDLEVIGNE